MYVHFFDDFFNTDTVQGLIDRLDEKKENGIRLHISTNGGNTDAINCLVDYINHNNEKIQVILTGIVMSAGTFFLTDLKRPVELSEELDFIMFHAIDYEEYTKRKFNDWFDTEKRKKGNDDYNEWRIEKYKKLGLTEEELEIYRSGGEVYLYREDFDRLNITAAE